MKKVLITGKGSYIGTKVEEWLQKYPDKYSVDVLDMLDGSWEKKNFSGYDAVYHVAGIAHRKDAPDQLYEDVNHKLAVNVAKKANEEGVGQFIFMSSGAVYSQNDKKHRYLVVDEDSPLDPSTTYGRTKLEAERDILAINGETKVAILRPPMVYGPGAKGNYNALAHIAKKFSFFPYANNTRSMIYIDNLCEFIRLLIDSGEAGVYLPQNKEYINTSELVQAIGKCHGKKIRLIKGLGWIIKFMGLFIDSVNKAFGTYYYKNKKNYFNGEYQVVDFAGSVSGTEGENK